MNEPHLLPVDVTKSNIQLADETIAISMIDEGQGQSPAACPRRAGGLAIPNRWRAYSAELLGTFVLVFFGLASNCQALLGKPDESNFLSLRIGWAAGVLVAVLATGGISGAHLNPAVTLTLAVYRKFPLKHILPYICAQLLGALLAGIVCQGVYWELFNSFEGGAAHRSYGSTTATASMLITSPQPWLSNIGAFFNEAVGTAALMIAILATAKPEIPLHMRAAFLSGAVIAVSGAVGLQTGFALNPARDLGPRIACAIFGYPATIWTDRNGYFFYGPIAGPIVGAVVGAGLHDLLVGEGIPLLPRSGKVGSKM